MTYREDFTLHPEILALSLSLAQSSIYYPRLHSHEYAQHGLKIKGKKLLKLLLAGNGCQLGKLSSAGLLVSLVSSRCHRHSSRRSHLRLRPGC